MNTLYITNYKPKEFAKLLNVSVKTLQRWDREKTLIANRTPTNRRYYTYDQYLQFKGIGKDADFRKINKSSKVKRLEKRLRREQRRLSRKYEFRKKKGGMTATASVNIDKQKLKVQKIHHRIDTIREDYENKVVHEIVKQKPRFITNNGRFKRKRYDEE